MKCKDRQKPVYGDKIRSVVGEGWKTVGNWLERDTREFSVLIEMFSALARW